MDVPLNEPGSFKTPILYMRKLMSERNNLSKVRLEYWPLGSQSSALPMDPKTLFEPGGLRLNLISPP